MGLSSLTARLVRASPGEQVMSLELRKSGPELRRLRPELLLPLSASLQGCQGHCLLSGTAAAKNSVCSPQSCHDHRRLELLATKKLLLPHYFAVRALRCEETSKHSFDYETV